MSVTLRFLVALVMLSSFAAYAGSARITLSVAPQVDAAADFWPGEVGRPAVLILHGFLQTRDFPTVRRLAESLADEGYSVLLPTLSLGMSQRRQSLACEALHTHSMAQDVDELAAWVEWLVAHSGKRPVLVGHSAGAVQIAALLDAGHDLQVERAVLISLPYFGEEQGPQRLAALREQATNDLAVDADAMRDYELTFCHTYVTSPAHLLSYLEWDGQRLRGALGAAAAPVDVIYGSADRRVDRDWLRSLHEVGVVVRPVDGANHFFDLAHEFDLLDMVLGVIEGRAHG